MQTEFYKNFFKGKKITKQGFGYLGRGFGVVKFLLECGAIVTVTDTKERGEFAEQIAKLNELGFKEIEEDKNGIKVGQIKYVFGKHEEQDFTNCDFVIQASGVPKNNFYLNLAKQNNVPVYQESSLFVKLVQENFSNVKIVGVTGTRGKTTTTFLIYEVLKRHFHEQGKVVHLGGNVEGVATLELLKNINEGDVVVMELDSWILQGFGEIKYSPNISVFTSFMPDHMNYYKGDMKDYFLDKANIFLNQKEADIFITTSLVLSDIRKYLGTDNLVKSKNMEVIKVSELDLDTEKNYYNLNKFETNLLGKHNQIAVNLAYRVAKNFNIDELEFKSILKNFTGVKGRLEFIKEIKGVKIYNDTCSTTPDATIAGLDALSEELLQDKKIILICGGRDKELGLENFTNKLRELQNVNKLELIVLKDETTTGSEKLLENLKIKNTHEEVLYKAAENLKEALKTALAIAKSGDVVLFSPGFASFGMFKNEYDRGDKFVDEVSEY